MLAGEHSRASSRAYSSACSTTRPSSNARLTSPSSAASAPSTIRLESSKSSARAGPEAAAGAGDDDRADVLARGAILEQVEVQGLQLGRPRVEPVGPVQRQQRDVIFDLLQHDFAHRSSSVETNTKRTPAISSG